MISQIALPAALAFIMFATGLALTVDDFRRVVVEPRAVAVGLILQMLALPALAALMVTFWPMRPEFAVGLIILAACPAGITSNLLTHLAGGHTALAVSLTAISSVAGTLTVPFLANLALAHIMGTQQPVDLPVARMTLGVFLVATLPLLIAMTLRAQKPQWAGRLEKPTRKIATILFALIVLGAFASQWSYLTQFFAQVVPPTLALNLGAMGLGFMLARIFRLSGRDATALIVVGGLQNAALGIFVAATLLRSDEMMTPSIIFAMVMNVTVIAYILATRKWSV